MWPRSWAGKTWSFPGAASRARTKEFSVKVKGNLRNVSDFNDLIVASYQGVPVRIRDIGRAEDGMEEKRSYSRFNGQPVRGHRHPETDRNQHRAGRRPNVKKEMERIGKTLPPGMKLNIAFDQSIFIKQSINQVQDHLIIGAILAVIAVFLFLRNIRTTLISAVALPVSVISTFALIRAFDFTFNNLTMLALTLSVGILIDDAIIVIENIYRHIEEGMAPREAAIVRHVGDRAGRHGHHPGHRGHLPARGLHEGHHRTGSSCSSP